MKTLDRELSRAKVSANRVAVVVANEWKDANDKVMPVKQWLEDRRFMQVSAFTSSLFALIPLPIIIWKPFYLFWIFLLFMTLFMLLFGDQYNDLLTFLQGEMQQLRDKLSIAERTSKYEAQLKVFFLSSPFISILKLLPFGSSCLKKHI